MKPNVMPGRGRRRPHGDAAGSAPAVLAACVLALCLPLPASATMSEPALRPALTLTPPATDFPADERALLRAEYHAAQARDAEADIVGDILARVRRINGMVNDIHGLMAAWPIAGGVPPPAGATAAVPTPAKREAGPATTTAVPAAVGDAGTAPSSTTLALRALMASVIIFLFWLLGKRHHYIKAQRLRVAASPEVAAPPTLVPESEALVAMPPPAPDEPVRPTGADPHPFDFSGATVAPKAAPAAPPAPPPVPAPVSGIEMSAPLEFVIPDDRAAQAAAGEPRRPAFTPGADQSLELAEIMVSMGLAQGAADTLTEHIRANPKRALYHWLKLLDVYRRAQMKDEFERVAGELRQSFNVQPAAWDTGAGSFSIEDYPHLVGKLLQLWPSPDCAEFLRSLLADNRGGTRNGLPQCVAEEILLLEQILDTEAAAAAA